MKWWVMSTHTSKRDSISQVILEFLFWESLKFSCLRVKYGAIGQKVSHYKPLIAFRSRHTAWARFRSMAKEEAMASRFSMGVGGSRGPGLK